MSEAEVAAVRDEVQVLQALNHVFGQVRFPGTDAEMAYRGMKYLTGKLEEATAKLPPVKPIDEKDIQVERVK